MGPLTMMMIGVKALKALILAVVSLTVSKLMLLKKFNGGGGGWSSGGGSWMDGSNGHIVRTADWSSDKDDRNAHTLAYAGHSHPVITAASMPATGHSTPTAVPTGADISYV